MKNFPKNILLLFYISFLSISTLLFGQVQFIPLNVDYAVFRAPQGNNYIEIYLSFFQNNIQYAKTDSGLIAQFQTHAEILKDDSVIAQNEKVFHSIVQSVEEIKPDRQLLDMYTFELPPGDYTAKVVVRDLNSNGLGEFLLDIASPAFHKTDLTMSDIQLCSDIQKADVPSEFNKNTYRVLPNPSDLYGIKLPVIYYYTEIYNLAYQDDKKGTYRVETYITDKEGNVIREFPSKIYHKPGTSAVVVGGYNIITLASETYFFNVKITDETTGRSVMKSKRFRLYKPSKEQLEQAKLAQTARTNPELALYLNFSEEELDREFERAKYIATPEEKSIYETLDVNGKRQFLAEFWHKRDTDPETPVNEFKEEYFSLLRYANQYFGAMRKEGWRTDRGRVLLTYGRPDEIERNTMQIDKKPYEIWHYYNLEGGSIFVFADLRGFGEYELIHSTYSKEIQQPDWERLVRKAETGGPADFQANPPQ